MKKIVRVIGLLLCVGSMVLAAFALFAYLNPPEDPTGANAFYDQGVQQYNEQMKKFAEANPSFPALPKGKTVAQAHKEDAMTGFAVAGMMLLIGLLVSFVARSRQPIAE